MFAFGLRFCTLREQKPGRGLRVFTVRSCGAKESLIFGIDSCCALLLEIGQAGKDVYDNIQELCVMKIHISSIVCFLFFLSYAVVVQRVIPQPFIRSVRITL